MTHQETLLKKSKPYEWGAIQLRITMQSSESWVTKSRLNKTSAAVIDYYWETLNLPLQKQLLGLENPNYLTRMAQEIYQIQQPLLKDPVNHRTRKTQQ